MRYLSLFSGIEACSVAWAPLGWSHPEEGDPNSRESLFWREENGQYGVRQIEAAWRGWQMREVLLSQNV